MEIREVGDRALRVSGADPAAVRAHLLAASPDGVLDAVVGASSLLILLRPGVSPAAVTSLLRAGVVSAVEPREVVIPVVYDGPDLTEVASLAGRSVEEVVRRHAAGVYTVDFLGFAPGFGYLSGLDPALRVPRRDTPRERVPAGSVAVADDRTAVYPRATPGGWRLLGRTDAVLFAVDRDPPALLAPGDRVRFRAA